MKNVIKLLRKQMFAAVATLALVAGVASHAFAGYGPDRPTLTWNGNNTPGANHVVFNSFVNNPVWGDERDFMRGAVEQRDNQYKDPVADVKDGDTVNVVMFIHNNADSSLNASGAGVAVNTTVKADIPNAFSQSQDIKGYITADNANPGTVFDTVTLNGASAFAMQYVPGSVKISGNNINQDLPGVDITKGFKVGDQLDGKMKGCFEYIQYVTFKVKIVKPALSIEKTERKLGEQTWVKDMTANPGDTIEYRLKITNTGKSDLTNITVGDRLPPYLTYVPGSTRLYNALTPPEGTKLNDGIVPGALRLNATYQPGSSAFIVFQAKVDMSIKDKECGSPRMRNVAATHSDQVKTDVEDTADVVINTGKVCQTPTYVCEDLNVTKTPNSRKVRVTVKPTITGQGVTAKNVTINYGDGSQAKVTNKMENGLFVDDYEYKTDGTFKVTGSITFTVNGTDKTVPVTENCSEMVTYTSAPTKPQTLVETGPGSIVGLFVATSTLGAAAHYVFSRRRGEV